MACAYLTAYPRPWELDKTAETWTYEILLPKNIVTKANAHEILVAFAADVPEHSIVIAGH